MFAVGAHEAIQQKRKYSGEPYWKHLYRVSDIVGLLRFKLGFDIGAKMIETAWLHDVIEDTPITEEILKDWFDPDVVEGVVLLSNNKDIGSRKLRKQMEVERLINAPNWVKTVKLADVLDNARDFRKHDLKYAEKVWFPEKRVLLEEALKGGDQALWDETWEAIQ